MPLGFTQIGHLRRINNMNEKNTLIRGSDGKKEERTYEVKKCI